MEKNETTLFCQGCGSWLPRPNAGYGWRSVLVTALCGRTTLCSKCWTKWGRPLRGWARRWAVGGTALGGGLIVTYAGAAAGSSGLMALGLALLLFGLAVRPPYIRPPDPPGENLEKGGVS